MAAHGVRVRAVSFETNTADTMAGSSGGAKTCPSAISAGGSHDRACQESNGDEGDRETHLVVVWCGVGAGWKGGRDMNC